MRHDEPIWFSIVWGHQSHQSRDVLTNSTVTQKLYNRRHVLLPLISFGAHRLNAEIAYRSLGSHQSSTWRPRGFWFNTRQCYTWPFWVWWCCILKVGILRLWNHKVHQVKPWLAGVLWCRRQALEFFTWTFLKIGPCRSSCVGVAASRRCFSSFSMRCLPSEPWSYLFPCWELIQTCRICRIYMLLTSISKDVLQHLSLQ